jgi:hypothetical protein
MNKSILKLILALSFITQLSFSGYAQDENTSQENTVKTDFSASERAFSASLQNYLIMKELLSETVQLFKSKHPFVLNEENLQNHSKIKHCLMNSYEFLPGCQKSSEIFFCNQPEYQSDTGFSNTSISSCMNVCSHFGCLVGGGALGYFTASFCGLNGIGMGFLSASVGVFANGGRHIISVTSHQDAVIDIIFKKFNSDKKKFEDFEKSVLENQDIDIQIKIQKIEEEINYIRGVLNSYPFNNELTNNVGKIIASKKVSEADKKMKGLLPKR